MKTLNLFFSPRLPLFLTVRTYGGGLLAYVKVYSPFCRVVIRGCERNFIISARPFSSSWQEEVKYIRTEPCSTYNLYFDFEPRSACIETLQSFTLSDAEYAFPIERATMNFVQIYR